MSPDPSDSIDLMAQLPIKISPVQWRWTLLLSIPRADLQRITNGITTLRWIRYAAGVVLGTEFVTLSYTNIRRRDFDYDASFPDTTTKIYAHVDETHRDSLLPAEPYLVKRRTSSSCSTQHRAETKALMDERDNTCVVTNDDAAACEDAHLIPHDKSDEYIRIYTEATQPECGVINNIDDIHNMIRLTATLHRGLGKFLAIMPRPNFAFPSPAERSWEFHPIKVRLPAFNQRQPVRAPTGRHRKNWPPDQLFNHVYGAALLDSFGVGSEANEVLLRMSESYYGPDGRMSAQQRAHAQLLQQREDAAAEKAKQDQARQLRHDMNKTDDAQYDDMPEFALWQRVLPREIQAELYAQLRQRAENAVHETAAAKVEAWRQTLSA